MTYLADELIEAKLTHASAESPSSIKYESPGGFILHDRSLALVGDGAKKRLPPVALRCRVDPGGPHRSVTVDSWHLGCPQPAPISICQ